MIFNRLSKKGAQGIGTLIIFIAMILVAAVAAGVLIQTGSALQSKSLDVGRQSQERLTSDIEVIQVYSTSGNSMIRNGTDNVSMILRLGSGSTAIKLSDLLIRYDTTKGTQSLIASGDGNWTTSTYGIDYQVRGSNNVAGYLTSGDLALVTFTYDTISPIVEGESSTIRLISKNGAIKPIQMTTPSAMTEQIVYLFP